MDAARGMFSLASERQSLFPSISVDCTGLSLLSLFSHCWYACAVDFVPMPVLPMARVLLSLL